MEDKNLDDINNLDFENEIEEVSLDNENLPNNLKKELNYLKQIKNALDKTTIISKTDKNGIITDANAAFEKISGYKKEELIGNPHNIVRHPEMPKAVFRKMWQTIQKGKIFRGIIKNRKKDGGEYYVLANIVPIKDESGEIEEYIAIRQDITKQITLQKEKEDFVNNAIFYLSNKIHSPVYIFNKYTKLIDEELQSPNPDLNKIKAYNENLKRDSMLLALTDRILKTLLEFNTKKQKINLSSFKPFSLFIMVLNRYKNIYNKKVFISVNDNIKKTVIKTDKKYLTLTFEIILNNLLKDNIKELKINFTKDEEFIEITFEYFQKELKEINFTNGFKSNKDIENNVEMYLLKRITTFLSYETEAKENRLILKIPILPPKKLIKYSNNGIT